MDPLQRTEDMEDPTCDMDETTEEREGPASHEEMAHEEPLQEIRKEPLQDVDGRVAGPLPCPMPSQWPGTR